MLKRAKLVKWIFLSAAMLLVIYLGYLMLAGPLERVKSVAGSRQRSTELYSLKGTIYDRNLRPITNGTKCYYLLLDPRQFPREQAEAVAGLCGLETEQLLGRLDKEGPFVLCSAERPKETAGMYVYEGVRRYGDVADHLVGYINGDLDGVTGLEKCYDSVLSYFGENKTLQYSVDGRNNPLLGLGMAVESDAHGSKNGVITTLDLTIQKALETAMDTYVERGAAVVLDIHSGEIRAMASRPDFDAEQVAKYLTSGQGELIDRALTAQTVGSVFKIVVAAAALEKDMGDFSFECGGGITVGDRTFTCPVAHGHGKQDLEGAFAESCNGYFIALGQLLGGETVMEMAKRLGFGESMQIAKGLYASAGTLPDITGNSAKQLANFSIGQGDLMATPLQIARLAAVCGNGGYLLSPGCFQGFYVDRKIKSEQWMERSCRVVSAETAERLRQLCVATVEKGTGQAAMPAHGGAGGKTSSAQTGVFTEDGREVLNTYFAGFFPAEEPRFAIAVFAEDGISGGKTCAPVFRQICQSVLSVKKD